MNLSHLVKRRKSRAPDPNDKEARYVYVQGPEEETDAHGRKTLTWSVFVGDVNELPTGQVYECGSYEAAAALARRMATQRKLEIVADATDV